jgi:hypothetical protein
VVAIIKTGQSIHRTFNYNENKVKEGKAECIGAGNFGMDADKLTNTIKLNRFTKQLCLNENVKVNTVHISLNFDVSESNLSKEKLLEIADTYMDKTGFGNQPYLVYQHHDSGHPHLHVATINIQSDGKRIDLHHLGIRKSEPARKEIEELFGLVKAQDQKKREYNLEPISQRVQYGKLESKKAIQNVLNFVVKNYKYTSLPELNAVLKQYNVWADKGSENSRVAQHNGLLYHILNADGKPIGVPIKASSFYSKPTLENLEKKYGTNEVIRSPNKSRIKSAIDMAFIKDSIIVLPQLIKALEKEGINTVLRQNDDGILYGITYVDHKTKCVFNGSALGKAFSAKGIQERCAINNIGERKENQMVKSHTAESLMDIMEEYKGSLSTADISKILDALTKVEYTSDYVPRQFKSEKKKKNKKRGL